MALEIDWASAAVDDALLTVGFKDKLPSGFGKELARVIDRLGRPGNRWGEIEVKKGQLRVSDVTPGAEPELRHFLESALLQASTSAGLDEDEGGEGDERSGPDDEM